MGNRTLIRHDGSTVTVPEQDADKLLTLGYREQTPTQELEEGISRGIEKFYTTPGQQAKTAVEGGLSGLSLGLTDVAFGSEESRERARYNPGIRLASELLGGLAPLGPGAIGRAAKYTVAGGLTEGARAAGAFAEARSGSKLIGTATRTTVEGAGFGAGAAVTNAQLNGDPVTTEAIMAGMGWGALYGGGLGVLGAGVEARMEARIARKAAEETTHLARKAAIAAEHEAQYGVVAAGVRDAAEHLGAVKATIAAEAKTPNFASIRASQHAIKAQLSENYLLKEVAPIQARAMVDLDVAQAAAKKGQWEKMNTRLEKFQDKMVEMESRLGGPKFFSAEKAVAQAETLIGEGKLRVTTAVSAAEEVTKIAALRETLKNFPQTAKELTQLYPKAARELSAAVDQLGKLKSAELAGVQEGVKSSIAKLAEGLGVTLDGTPGMQLKEIRQLMKESKKEAARARGKGAFRRGIESTARYAGGRAGASRYGVPGYIVGSTLVSGLLGLKGAILGTIASKADKWVPRGARALQKVGSRAEPLKQRIDGTVDGEHQDRKELMAARAYELHQAAPAVRDTLYKAVSPLSQEHPELAASLHAQGVARFQFILSKLPKDPGLAYSNLKSIWKPDPVAMEKFARYYEVFHDPVGVVTRALDSGKITMEAAEGLQEMNPELWSYLRVHLLERLGTPEVLDKMTYSDQVHLGLLLGIPLHSTMDPRFVAAQQQMYTERNQPLEMNPRVQPGGGAGRPSGPGPSATAGQRISEH